MKCMTAFAAALALVSPASSHHSDAGLDMNSVVPIVGRVTEFSWRNPHVYFTVEATDERGESIEWTLQMAGTITTSRMGWTRNSLSVGDRVTVGAHPALDGRPYGLMNSIEKEGGTPLPTSFDSNTAEPQFAEPEVSASTNTLEGIWMAKNSELVSYTGGFDGFFGAQLRLTEKGADAQAAYDAFSDENPESSCIGRPTPAMIVSSNLFPLQIEFNGDEEIVMIRSEFWDEERTVYMDGRAHPGASGRFATGHSIGWWEDETLVVDTTNFTDHRSPYQIGVPSGAQKHVVEGYRLNDEGTRIFVEFTLEDPEYIAEPLTNTRELIYSPHLEMSRFDCDPEATRRFLPQPF